MGGVQPGEAPLNPLPGQIKGDPVDLQHGLPGLAAHHLHHPGAGRDGAQFLLRPRHRDPVPALVEHIHLVGQLTVQRQGEVLEQVRRQRDVLQDAGRALQQPQPGQPDHLRLRRQVQPLRLLRAGRDGAHLQQPAGRHRLASFGIGDVEEVEQRPLAGVLRDEGAAALLALDQAAALQRAHRLAYRAGRDAEFTRDLRLARQ